MKILIVSFSLIFCSFAVSNEPQAIGTLNLQELALAITEYNKIGDNRIASLEDLEVSYVLIEGALPPQEYKKQHNLTKEELIKEIFSNVYHLPIKEIPQTIGEWNRDRASPMTLRVTINSLRKYNVFCKRIHGALSSGTYQVLYGISKLEFINVVFGSNEHFLTLTELPSAIETHNGRLKTNKIVSLDSFRDHHIHIPGALTYEMYKALYGFSREEFIQKTFGRMKHLEPKEQLSQAIREFHDKVRSNKIFSLDSYSRYRSEIKGAYSFDTYNVLYEITREEFQEIIESTVFYRTLTAEEFKAYEQQQRSDREPTTTQTNITSVESIPLLTLEETPQAVISYNRQKTQQNGLSNNHLIDSWGSYRKYHERIPGADSPENLEKQHLEEYGTLRGFSESLLGQQRKDLSPIELSQAIAKYNSEVYMTEQIDYVEDYGIWYYRIPHAPTLEAFEEFARENWNDSFQDRFGTVKKYVESILLNNSCEKAVGTL